jgi:hypothetical protein
MIYPTILDATISTVVPNSARSPEETALQNRTKRTLRIDEIRFRVMRTGEDARDHRGWWTGSVQIRLGNEPITSGLVPLPAMTWPEIDAVGEYITADPFAGSYLRFSKPVHIHPGESLALKFQTIATSSAAVPPSTDLGITVICREAKPNDRSYLPWISFYKAPLRAIGENAVDMSTEADLLNPFDSDLFVERLVGRIDGDDDPDVAHAHSFTGVKVRIEDHDSIQIVRDLTPFGVVFDYVKRSWMINSTLRSRGFYKVVLESNMAHTWLDTGSQPFIGMLGYRPAGWR